jgi:hypothetical protein
LRGRGQRAGRGRMAASGEADEGEEGEGQGQSFECLGRPEVVGWAGRLLPRPVGRGEGWGEGKPY